MVDERKQLVDEMDDRLMLEDETVQRYSHFVILEEFFELTLGCCVGEIPNVQPTSLSSTGEHSVGGGAGGILDARVGEVIGEIVNGRRHCG